MQEGHLDLVRTLIQAGADVDVIGLDKTDGRSCKHCLHSVMDIDPHTKLLKILQLLIDAGADVNNADVGYTPLHFGM